MTFKFGSKEWFVLIILILLLTDLTILLNIPFMRQIFGFLLLTILPGVLILQILKLNKVGSTEKFVLSVGLSISFLMFFGLLINNLSLYLGYETPLATIPLLISFNIAFIVLAIIGLFFSEKKIVKPSVSSKLDFCKNCLPSLNLSTSEQAFLIVPFLFPALSIFGMHLMNTTDNNTLLMFLLFLIPIYVASVFFLNQKFPKRLYPVVIFLIGISLLLLLSLRSNHIIGVDTHQEYFAFRTTLDNLYWQVLHGALGACLSISLLPTIYQSILNIAPEFLFRILYSLIYSISPLVIYVLSKKYVGQSYAFLASIVFMANHNFLWTEWNARTNIAILFFGLAMMTLFSDKMDALKKRILFIVFMASCMVSHYSTTYIFFIIMLGSFLGMEILSKKYTFKKIISLTIVLLFFALIFFWYSQATGSAFYHGVRFVKDTFLELNNFFIMESRGGSVRMMIGEDIMQKGIPNTIEFLFTWLMFILIGIGVTTLIRRYKEMSFPERNFKKPDFLKDKFEVTYFVIALICSGLMVAMVVVPYIAVGYNLDRLYGLTITVLSVFLVIGGIIFSKHFFFLEKRKPVLKEKNNCFFGKAFFSKERFDGKNALQNPIRKSVGGKKGSQVRAYLIILLVLIPYFFCVTGVMYQMFGVPHAIILSSEGETYDRMYVHDQESYGAKWLKEHDKDKTRIYCTDDYVGRLKLMSQGNIPKGAIDISSFRKDRKIKGYIYLGYYNVVDGKLFGGTTYLSDYSYRFIGKSKIYANGGSEVYR